MKRMGLLGLAAGLCLLCLIASAEEPFAIDRQRVYTGMAYSYAQGYEPQMGRDGLNLSVPITSGAVKGALTATLIIDRPEWSPFLEPEITKTVPQDNSRAAWHVSFTLRLRRDACNGLYRATLRLSGKDKAGDPVTQEFPMTIPLRAAAEEAIAAPLEIVSVQAGDGGLRLGQPGQVLCTLRNMGQRTALTDLWVKLEDAAGDILPAARHAHPVASLAPGEETTLTLPVLLQPDSRPRLHVLTVSAQYTRFSGAPDSVSRSFTLPVTQEMRLSHGRPHLPARVTQDSLVNFTMPLMNMGRGTIHNALLTFHLPGLAEDESILAGSIAPGDTVQASATFKAGSAAPGIVEGCVDISYEDAQGTQGSLTLPLTTQVVARQPEPAPDAAPTAGGTSTASAAPAASLLRLWGPAALAGLLLVLLVWQGIHYRGRLRRMEEQRL